MRNQGVLLTVGISCLLFAAIVFYVTSIYMPATETRIMQEYAGQYSKVKVFYVAADTGIYKDTTITDDLFNEGTIQLLEIPAVFLPENGFGVFGEYEKSSVLNKKTKKTLVKGEFLLKDAFNDEVYSDEEQFKRRNDYVLHNSVAGEVKTGMLVDIMVDYRNGDFDIVVPKIRVERLVKNENGEAQVDEDGKSLTTVILSVNEDEYRDLELAKRLGYLTARVYKSEKQYASMKTFKYKELSIKAQQIARNQFLTGDIESYLDSQYIGFLGDKTNLEEKAFRVADQEAKNKEAAKAVEEQKAKMQEEAEKAAEEAKKIEEEQAKAAQEAEAVEPIEVEEVTPTEQQEVQEENN